MTVVGVVWVAIATSGCQAEQTGARGIAGWESSRQIDELERNVRYHDNAANLQATFVPVPSERPGLAD